MFLKGLNEFDSLTFYQESKLILYIFDISMGCCFSVEQEYVQGNKTLSNTQVKHSNQFNMSNDYPVVEPNPKDKMIIQDGEKFKQEGNHHFKNKNYPLAIIAYKKAIVRIQLYKQTVNPDISYFSNLALTYKANRQYQQGIDTINLMMQNKKFQSQSDLYQKGKLIKARCAMIQVKQYCLGGKFTQIQNNKNLGVINMAIQILQSIFNISQSLDQQQQFLFTGRRIKQFIIQELIPKSKAQSLLHYLQKRLMKTSEGESFQNKSSGIGKYFKNKKQVLSEMSSIVQSLKLTALQQQKQYFNDPITYEFLTSPVLIPSGTTYNESTLKLHFKNNGYNDPITHQIFEIGEKVVVRNNNLRSYSNQVRKLITKEDVQLLKY